MQIWKMIKILLNQPKAPNYRPIEAFLNNFKSKNISLTQKFCLFGFASWINVDFVMEFISDESFFENNCFNKQQSHENNNKEKF